MNQSIKVVNENEVEFKLLCPVCKCTTFISGIELHPILYDCPVKCVVCGKSKVNIDEKGNVSLIELTEEDIKMEQLNKPTYRANYSPKCIHCINYSYADDYCEAQTDDEPEFTYPTCNQFKPRTDDYCDSCGKPYEEGIDEDITEHDGYEEFWGARVQRPDVLVGFICNDCGETNEF